MKLKDFKINYRVNPIGLDELPRFSWKLVSEKENTVQQAYQIQVIRDGRMAWDTGRVESGRSILVPYEGTLLKPVSQYLVRVNVWDNHGEMGEACGSFETGVLTEDYWEGRADWITHALPETEEACPVFVRELTRRPGKVESARVFVACCGVYELEVNGRKAGDAFLAPGWTSYHNRLQYQAYDVTGLLHTLPADGGQDEIAITVGNGWYKGYLGFTNTACHYGNRTGIRAFISIRYEDGAEESMGTDTGWNVMTGCIRSAELYHGETQDFTFGRRAEGKAVPFEPDPKPGRITAQESEPVRITRRFPAKEKIITPKGELVIDFGQNMAGIVEVRLPHLTGEKLVIRHGETLDKEGNFYTENLRQARAEDVYLYTVEQEDTVALPHFTFHGFRYICLEGVDQDVDMGRFTACALHTDMEETGSFACDNALVNQLQSNIIWGQRSNFLDIPTDCPQRDERLGWTGDAQVFCSTAGYLFQTALFFRKWLHDMAAETTPLWGVPHVVPNILGDQAGAAAWSDAAVIIPWTMYTIYGDPQFLEDQLDCMMMWVDYIHDNCRENGLWQSGYQYGDWLGLDKEEYSNDRTGATDRYLIANAYYALSTLLTSQAAGVLGREKEQETYAKRYQEIRKNIQKEYVTAAGRLVSETQTACVVMLYFDLLKEEDRPRVLKALEENLAAHRYHLTTGFVGTPYLCHCLSENGKHSLAEAVFGKEDFPGWFYAVKKGATTVWERWNSILPNGDFDSSGMNSLNHYAYGSIGDWMYRKIAGINPEEPGYRRIRIQPLLTQGMTCADASFESVYGTIRSAWSCRGGKLTVDVEVPANTRALIVLPEGHGELEKGSGSYHFEFPTDTCLEKQRFTMESTLGEVLAEELAVTLFEQYVPGMLDTPMIQYAYDMTMAELTAAAPDAKPLYESVLAALNKAKMG